MRGRSSKHDSYLSENSASEGSGTVNDSVPSLQTRPESSSQSDSIPPPLVGRHRSESSDEIDYHGEDNFELDSSDDSDFPNQNGGRAVVCSSSEVMHALMNGNVEDDASKASSDKWEPPALILKRSDGSDGSESSIQNNRQGMADGSDSDTIPGLIERKTTQDSVSQSEEDSDIGKDVPRLDHHTSSSDESPNLMPIPSRVTLAAARKKKKRNRKKKRRARRAQNDAEGTKRNQVENRMEQKKKKTPVYRGDPKWEKIASSIALVDNSKWTPENLEAVLQHFVMDPVCCRDPKGETLLHLATIENNCACLEWLVKIAGLDPSVANSDGKAAIDITAETRTSNKLRRLKMWSDKQKKEEELRQTKLRTDMAVKIQTLFRTHLAKMELGRLRDTCAYSESLPVIYEVMDYELGRKRISDSARKSWADLKRELDLVVQDDPDLVGDAALQMDDTGHDDDLEYDGELEEVEPATISSRTSSQQEQQPEIYSIQLTANVLTWIRRQGDQTHVDMFTKRLKQLAKGDCSNCLSKRLKGSNRVVMETKLDKGMRIIWTRREKEILVWFVCHHDQINRCLKRVNLSYQRVFIRGDAENGSACGTTKFYDSPTMQDAVNDEPEMLVSPFSNVPLKIHSLCTTEIDNLATNSQWTPPIKLTKQEEEIVKKQGTVLVLGRSGTGKTLCVCNRIDYDRKTLGPETRQLFLARTNRLCGFVKRLVSKTTTVDEKLEFKRVVDWVEELQMKYVNGSLIFSPSKHISYRNFRNQIFDDIKGDEKELDVLQVWTQIRSFIKGSFESAKARRPLTVDEYLDLSKDRCRLDKTARRKAYKIFQRYDDMAKINGWWDDMDRVTEVIHELQVLRAQFPEPLYDKIYVDEVQDITQAEIGLFFLVSGYRPDSLFLAGDPAQAVAQGVDFRFEEVRSVVHMISGGEQKVERWQKLFQNFRSHEGILSVANVVLDCLHRAFPNAAVKLTPDTGLVQGPRPGLIEANVADIAEMLRANERIRVLVRDGQENELKKQFPNSEYAFYGIIEAKGLEFSDVLIVDFFSKCDSELQKEWKKLLRDSMPTYMGSKLRQPASFPRALELELKLLYTAITRTQNRMHFIETKESEAFNAWKRLLTKMDRAETMKLDAAVKEGTTSKLMTADEWRVEGIEMALRAEEDDGEDPPKMLQRAIWHFRKAKDPALEARAQAQLKATKLEFSAMQSLLSSSQSVEETSDGSKAVVAYLDAGLVGEASRACNELWSTAGLTGLGARIEKLARSSDNSKVSKFVAHEP